MTFPRYVAEIANNHQGSVEHGKAVIDAMAGVVDAVKFQYRDLSILHPDMETKHHARFKETYLTDPERYELVAHARDVGLVPIVTPFDEISVEMCDRHDVPVLKVASCSSDDWPLLESMASTGRPIIASTGGLGWDGIDNLYYFLRHRNVEFALMHCVGEYPVPNGRFNLRVIDKMRRRYDVPIGYSGHEGPENHIVGQMAIAHDAEILERHVGVPTDAIKLNAYSMNPEQTKVWVDGCKTAFEINGVEEKVISPEEAASMRELKRGFVVIDGKERFCMPCDGPTAGEAHTRLDPGTKLTREFVHEYEGMFREAGIPLTGSRELSHHYGIQRFRETGAFLVTVVNTEYCKKVIALLPGQAHPEHRHRIKDETFQVLWGEMSVTRDGIVHEMKKGATLHVPPGAGHAFRSRSGCIFEEISTRAVPGDSYYDKPLPDPMNRKTALD